MNTGPGQASQTITGLVGGATYDFEVYLATFDSTPQQDGMIVTLQFQDGAGSNLGSAVTLVDTDANASYPSSASWERRTTSGINAPSGTDQAVLTAEFIGDGGGFVDTFFDAFSLVQTAAPPTNSPPVFTTTTSSESVAENSTGVVFDFDANDGDGGADDTSVSYSLGGTDAGPFSIDANTGALTLDSARDFESPSDGDTNNDYELTVTADDGESSNNATTESVTVSITNVNEAPTVTTNAGLMLDEGTTKAIGTGALSATDEDAGDSATSLTYTVTGGPANGTLLVNGASASSFTQQNLADGAVEYEHDGSETTSDSFTFDLTDDEDAGPTGQTFAITVAAQNDAPTISALSDQEIEEDATLGPVGFTVDDQETAASSLTVTATSNDQTLVPDANITLGGSNANRTLEVSPAANESGSATITVTVDDGSGSNNTASDSFVLTVNAVPDLAITDGASSNLDFTADVSPGTENNAVGIFELSAGQSGATLDAVTITNNSPDVSGITNAHLYLSSDQALVPGEDSQVAGFDVTDGSAEGTFTFTSIGTTIPTSGYYLIMAIDVASGASASGIQFSLDQTSDLTVTGGEIATVNGTSQSTFSALPLSNGTTALPVELASFEATSEREAVTLQWQTASETDNAEFEIQRQRTGASSVTPSRRDGATQSTEEDADGWQTVGSVDGAGTTTEAQSYRFTDEEVPYGADSLTYRLNQVNTDGSTSYSEPISVARTSIQQVQLLGTYPNPARQQATVQFAIPDGSDDGVTLRLYDALGRQMRTIQASAQAGRHTLQLETGRLPSGVYFLRIQAGTTVKTQKLTVVQ